MPKSMSFWEQAQDWAEGGMQHLHSARRRRVLRSAGCGVLARRRLLRRRRSRRRALRYPTCPLHEQGPEKNKAHADRLAERVPARMLMLQSQWHGYRSRQIHGTFRTSTQNPYRASAGRAPRRWGAWSRTRGQEGAAPHVHLRGIRRNTSDAAHLDVSANISYQGAFR